MPWRRKLTDYDIRRIYSGDLTASEAGVSRVAVHYIKTGKNHAAVTGAKPIPKGQKVRVKI